MRRRKKPKDTSRLTKYDVLLRYLQPEDGLQKISELTKTQDGMQKLNEILDLCYEAIESSHDLEEGNKFRMSKEEALYYLNPQYRMMRMLQVFSAGRISLAVINNLMNTAMEALEQDHELDELARDSVWNELAEKKEERENVQTGKSEQEEKI